MNEAHPHIDPSDASALIRSWAATDGIESLESLSDWLRTRNDEVFARIVPVSLDECEPWGYDERRGIITNPGGNFFHVAGVRESALPDLDPAPLARDHAVVCRLEPGIDSVDRPLFVQDTVGFLGFICKNFDGVMHFLVQGKVEPGNVNKVQLSPTIQATWSNFNRAHGGTLPPYLDSFIDPGKRRVLIDSLQTEQSQRFFRKRNRNIVVVADDEVNVLPSHRWVTLGQMKELLKRDDIVHIDTRSILACLPLAESLRVASDRVDAAAADPALLASFTCEPDADLLARIDRRLVEAKMFRYTTSRFVDVAQLDGWTMDGRGIVPDEGVWNVMFADVQIDGREVRSWHQPLYRADEPGIIGLLTKVEDGVRKFHLRLVHDIGSFDHVDIGPGVTCESLSAARNGDAVERLLIDALDSHAGVLYDVMLSEEGGRFYQARNRCVIVDIDPSAPIECGPTSFWADAATIESLARAGACLNGPARDVLSLLRVI